MDSSLLEQVLSEANIALQAGKESECISYVYSELHQRLEGTTFDIGLYPTPLSLARFMVSIAGPVAGETIYDPACGLCGFFVEAYRYLRKPCRQDISNAFLGYDVNPYLLRIGKAWMEFEGMDTSYIRERALPEQGLLRPNLFEDWVDDSDRFKGRYLILTHPPYEKIATQQGKKRATTTDERMEYYDREFLRHCMTRLQSYPNGRCCMVVSLNLLINKRKPDVALRQKLLDDFDIQMIARLPKQMFASSHRGVHYHSYMLYFQHGRTSNVLRCNIREHEAPAQARSIQSPCGASFEEAADIWERWQKPSSDQTFSLTAEEQAYTGVIVADKLRQEDSEYKLIDDEPPLQQEERSASLEELLQQLVEQSAELQIAVQHLEKSIKEGV